MKYVLRYKLNKSSLKKTLLCFICIFAACLASGCASGGKQVIFLYSYEGKRIVLEDQSGLIRAPEVPERDGYDFGGWAYAWEDGEAKLWDFEHDEVRRDTVLTAVWTARSVNIYLDTDGGDGCPESIATYFGQPLSLPEPKKEGAWFMGWSYAAYRSVFQHKTVDFDHDIYLRADWLEFDPAATVRFGRFEQENVDDGPEDIEWYILDITDGKYILLSKKVLYSMTYEPKDPGMEGCTYENSAIREWLNNEFYGTAFSEAEKELMYPIEMTGLGITDNVTLMSKSERDRYLIQWRGDQLAAPATEYAVNSGLNMKSNGTYNGAMYCACWLRHEKKEASGIGIYPSYMVYILTETNGIRTRNGIRPMIIVDGRAFGVTD